MDGMGLVGVRRRRGRNADVWRRKQGKCGGGGKLNADGSCGCAGVDKVKRAT